MLWLAEATRGKVCFVGSQWLRTALLLVFSLPVALEVLVGTCSRGTATTAPLLYLLGGSFLGRMLKINTCHVKS